MEFRDKHFVSAQSISQFSLEEYNYHRELMHDFDRLVYIGPLLFEEKAEVMRLILVPPLFMQKEVNLFQSVALNNVLKNGHIFPLETENRFFCDEVYPYGRYFKPILTMIQNAMINIQAKLHCSLS